MDRERDRWTKRVGDTERDMQTDGQRKLGTERQTDRWTERVRNKRETGRQTHRERLGQREREADTAIEKQRMREDRERLLDRDRESNRIHSISAFPKVIYTVFK